MNLFAKIYTWIREKHDQSSAATDLFDEAGSDRRARVAQHEPTQIFEVIEQLDADGPLQLQLDNGTCVLRQAPAMFKYNIHDVTQ